MTIVLILMAWAILGLVGLVGFGIVMASWNKVADGMHKLDPKLRDAIQWPHRNLALVHIVGPAKGFRMWRAQTRTVLYGLPDTPRIPEDIRREARRYRRFSLLFSLPLITPPILLSLWANEFLLVVVAFPLVMALIAGRWPSPDVIEASLPQ